MSIYQYLSSSLYGKAFFLALSLLMRLPSAKLNEIQPSDSGRSALFYPFIGLIIGLLFYVPLVFLMRFLKLQSPL